MEDKRRVHYLLDYQKWKCLMISENKKNVSILIKFGYYCLKINNHINNNNFIYL